MPTSETKGRPSLDDIFGAKPSGRAQSRPSLEGIFGKPSAEEIANLGLLQANPGDPSVPTADRMAAFEVQGGDGMPSTTVSQRNKLKAAEIGGLGLMASAGLGLAPTATATGAIKNFGNSPGLPITNQRAYIAPALDAASGLLKQGASAALPLAKEMVLKGTLPTGVIYALKKSGLL